MKKKTAGKLHLSRETVRLLEDPKLGTAAVFGGSTNPCQSIITYVCSGCRPCL